MANAGFINASLSIDETAIGNVLVKGVIQVRRTLDCEVTTLNVFPVKLSFEAHMGQDLTLDFTISDNFPVAW